jgi:hypothetical protein
MAGYLKKRTIMTFPKVQYNFYCSQLKMRLDKNDTVRKSDWRTEDLSAVQQCYAATDAYVSKILNNHKTIHYVGVNDDVCKDRVSGSEQIIMSTPQLQTINIYKYFVCWYL